MKCLAKEGSPKLDMAVQDFTAEKQLMVETLTERVPDDDNTIEMDASFYWDHE
jgi:hypothetical protein